MNNLVETVEHAGKIIRVYQDESPESPRELDNLGTMLCNHRRYTLGDAQGSIKDLPDDAVITLPLFLYDHSGLSISTSISPYWFHASWDAGQVGVIYVTREKLLKEYGCSRITKHIKEKAAKVLEQEVRTYNQYLAGDVYGYVVEEEEGNDLESCWGFYGLDYCIEQAKQAAESCEVTYAI